MTSLPPDGRPFLRRAYDAAIERIPDRLIGALLPESIQQRLPVARRLDEQLRRLRQEGDVGEDTTLRSKFATMIVSYNQDNDYGRAQRLARELRHVHGAESLGPTKFTFKPTPEAQRALGIFHPVLIYDDLTPFQHDVYVAANEFLERHPHRYRVLPIRDRMDEVIIADFTDAEPADAFLLREKDPEFTRVVYARALDVACLLGDHFSRPERPRYDHGKLLESLEGASVKLSADTRALAKDFKDVLVSRSVFPARDPWVGNHFVDVLNRPREEELERYRSDPSAIHFARKTRSFAAIEALARYDSRKEAVARMRDDLHHGPGNHLAESIIFHDFETLSEDDVCGRTIADLVVRTPIDTAEISGRRGSLEEDLVVGFCERVGIAYDDALRFEIASRAARLLYRFGDDFPAVRAASARWIARGWCLELREESLDGLVAALNDDWRTVRGAARSAIPRSGTTS